MSFEFWLLAAEWRLALKFAEGASNELERQRAEAGVEPCGASSVWSPIARADAPGPP